MTETTSETTTYQDLAAPFEGTFHDVRGGVELEYITGEQCITRLNEILGFDGWSFRVLQHGYNDDADEFWVLGELTVTDGVSVTRQQFGSQKMKRSRSTDKPLDIGFDLKGATTDALKKCATLLGVGLYLSRKDAPAGEAEGAQGATRSGAQDEKRETLVCAQCEQELKEVKFRDGTTWPPLQLASYGRRKHGKVLCMDHYREANAAKQRASAQVANGSEVPF